MRGSLSAAGARGASTRGRARARVQLEQQRAALGRDERIAARHLQRDGESARCVEVVTQRLAEAVALGSDPRLVDRALGVAKLPASEQAAVAGRRPPPAPRS